MAAAKKVTRLAGDDANLKEGINEPPDTKKLLIAQVQLQDTVNELISRFNSHTHSAGAVAAPDVATRVQGVAVAATNLFVPPAS